MTLRYPDAEDSGEEAPQADPPILPEQNLTFPRPPTGPATAPQARALTPVSSRTITLLFLATMGAGIATLVPMAFTLALKLDQIAPGREELLGYILGANALSSLLTNPLTGILSDRTRTRWGRRRPYTVGGILLGISAVPIMVAAQDPVTLAVGWILMSLGFGTSMGSIGNFQADRLPPQQRGKVSGLSALAMQVSPVLGILLAGLVTDEMVWVFLLPALVGVALMLVFIVFVHEDDSRGLTVTDSLSLGKILRSYGFRPSAAPDFAWNWLGRFVFFFGLSLTTSFSTFFYAQRLDISVANVAGILAAISSLSIVSALIGSLGAGWLSDRTGRRRPFVLVASLLVGAGCAVSAFSWSLPLLLTGAFVSSLGIATFFAVNQAMTLDILPNRETEAGRYMAIMTFSQRIPTALAPLIAPALLALPFSGNGAEKNYAAIYLAAAAFAVIGGAIITSRVKSVS